MRNGIVEASGLEPDVPKGEMGSHEVGAQAKGLLQVSGRLLRYAEVLAGTAEVINEVGVVGLARKRSPKVIQRLADTVLPPTDHSQQQQGLAVGRIGLEDFHAERLGLSNFSGIVKLAGSGQCFGKCVHTDCSAGEKPTRRDAAKRYSSGRRRERRRDR